ncbi:MAG: LysM peptidoglycan-binding domain-containing protein [Anaerolineae bacterium]
MTECSACGAELKAHETRCPHCGKPTAFYHRQRRCLHCGTPAATKAVTCMMCGKPVDSLPLNTSIFSGSWISVGLGILIIIGLVIGMAQYQSTLNAQAHLEAITPTATGTATLTPTLTPTPAATDTPIPTATFTATPTPTPLIHIIKSGDNPSIIADLYGVNLDDLLKLNNITNVSTLQVGQVLLIPTGSKSDAPAEESKPVELVSYIIEVMIPCWVSL